MSHPPSHPRLSDLSADEQLDLLIDGELSDSQRRELLLHLESQPDGWRRCALAFLEAQTWREGVDELLGAIARPESGSQRPAAEMAIRAAEQPSGLRAGKEERLHPVSAATTPRATPPTPARRRWLASRPGTAVAMAASFLIALTLGSWLPTLWNDGGDGGGPTLPGAGQLAQDETPRAGAGPGASTGSELPGLERPSVESSAPPEIVTLVSEGDRPQRVQVPAREGQSLDRQWLRQLPTPMPPEVREALERMGHRVRQQRQLVPIEMEDGRRLVVPVDEVLVDPETKPPM